MDVLSVSRSVRGFFLMRLRKKYVNIEEMNALLKKVKLQCPNVYWRKKEKEDNFCRDAYIVEKETSMELSFCLGLKPCTYVCRFDEEVSKQQISGTEAYRILRKYYKETQISNAEEIGSAKQILYKNPKYDGKRVKAYGYDMRSAFSRFMLNTIPDVTTLRRNDIVRNGEVGFLELGEGELKATTIKGTWCNYVMKLIDCPEGYKKFVNHWYTIKETTKDTIEKIKAKNVLNFCIGYYQNTNPFIRAIIITRNNNYMKSLIDDNTVYCNTDSIVSTVRRPDIEALCGDKLGDFKFEHGKDRDEYFAWQSGKLNYQWNLDIPSCRRIPKSWFKSYNLKHKSPFDILTDELPKQDNPYYLDKERLEIKKKYGKEKKK